MNINDLTIGQAKELAEMFPAQPVIKFDFVVELMNKNVIVRTVTMIYTGKLVGVSATDIVLTDCSWIPETDRYMKFVAEGAVRECEPYPDGLPVIVGRGTLLDMCELHGSLPRSQK